MEHIFRDVLHTLRISTLVWLPFCHYQFWLIEFEKNRTAYQPNNNNEYDDDGKQIGRALREININIYI